MATISEALALAIRHHQAGRLEVAEQIYRRILDIEPNHPQAWHLRGLVAHQTGKHDVAIEYIGRAIALKGTEAAFHSNLGAAFQDLGKLDEAVASYRRALELKPGSAEAYNNLGTAFQDQRRLDEAVGCFRRALELRPDFAKAQNNLGSAFRDQWKLDEAVACCRRALQLKPDFAKAHCSLGNALQDQGKLEEALACYRRALELKPDSADAYNDLATALQDQRKLDEALAAYRRALELKPDHADAHLNLGIAWLLAGDWQHGWPEYEWRWRTKQLPLRPFLQPVWDGSPLEGKTILLHAEQGLGDAIQFVRYAPLIKRSGGTVIVECHKPLLPLLATCPGVDQLVGHGDVLPAFTTHAPLLSLPGIFQTALDTIPPDMPYLFASPALIAFWRERLRNVPGFRIGINWRGRPQPGPWCARDIPLQQFATLTEIPQVRLVTLQKDAGREELAEAHAHFPVVDLGDEVDQAHGAFLDTAAIMMNLDLVITSDTAVPHLAGALGVPVWVALPFISDWRWLLDRSDSPWYPTMRLFRQRERGNWQSVFEEIKQVLCARLRCGGPSGEWSKRGRS